MADADSAAAAAPAPEAAAVVPDAAAPEGRIADGDSAAGWLCTCCCMCCRQNEELLHTRCVGRCHAGCPCCADAAQAAAEGLAWSRCCCIGKGGQCQEPGPRVAPVSAAAEMAERLQSEMNDREAGVYRPPQYVSPVLPAVPAGAAEGQDAAAATEALWSGYLRSGYRVALAANYHSHSETCWKYGRLNDPTVTCRMGSVSPQRWLPSALHKSPRDLLARTRSVHRSAAGCPMLTSALCVCVPSRTGTPFKARTGRRICVN
jgi:hypothetical protein